MKKLLRALGLSLGFVVPVLAGPTSPPAGNYITNVSTNAKVQIFNVSSGTVSTQLNVNNIKISGTCTGPGCGGSGGSSALGVNYNGVSITSPTAQINFKGNGVTVGANSSTATVTINAPFVKTSDFAGQISLALAALPTGGTVIVDQNLSTGTTINIPANTTISCNPNISVTGTNSGNFLFFIVGDSVTIQNCNISGGQFSVIEYLGYKNISVLNNTITGYIVRGIDIEGYSPYLTINNNIIGPGAPNSTEPIFLQDTDTSATIDNNKIFTPGALTSGGNGAHGITLHTYVGNIFEPKVQGNVINNGGDNFGIEVTQNNVGGYIQRAIISDNKIGMVVAGNGGISIGGCDECKVINNTIDMNNTAPFIAGIEIVISTDAIVTGNQIINGSSGANGMSIDSETGAKIMSNYVNGSIDIVNSNNHATKNLTNNQISYNTFEQTPGSSQNRFLWVQTSASGTKAMYNMINNNRVIGVNASGTTGIYLEDDGNGGINGTHVVGNIVTGFPVVFGQDAGVTNTLYLAPTGTQGTGPLVQLSSGTTTTNDCAKFDAFGNVIDAGAACGSGSGGSGIVSPGTFTWVNNFGLSLSTLTVTSIKSPTSINQINTGTVESDLNFSQQGTVYGSFAQRYYSNSGPETFNYPFIINEPNPLDFTQYSQLWVDHAHGVSVVGSTNTSNTFNVHTTAIGDSPAFYVTGSGVSNSAYGLVTTTFTATSTATVAALSFSGSGNAQFSNDSVNYYQIVGSSASVTAGHLAVFSSSVSVVDGGVPGAGGVPSVNSNSNAAITSSVTLVSGTNVTLTQTGNTIAIASSGGGGGTPGGSSPQLQFNSTGTFAGVSGSYVTNSSITYSGAVQVTTMNVVSPGVVSANTQGSLVDIYSSTFLSGKPLFDIGSNDITDQFRVLNHLPIDMKNNGAQAGCLQMAGHNEGVGIEGGIFETCAANAGYQGIYISRGFTGELDLITATVGQGGNGGTIYFQPNQQTEVAISTYGVTISTGLTVISSVTVNGMLAVIATTTTTNMAMISTATVGGFGIDVSTSGHFNVFNSSVTRGPAITNGTGDASCSDVACTINASASPVTFTFAKPFTKVPVCIVTEQTDSLVNALSYSKTATALTITQTGLSGNLDVICIGRD